MANPIISICIPAYERPNYLKRLLDSINIQKFKNFEVIISDDSKTDQIKVFIENYKADFSISYHRNFPSLGSAKNVVKVSNYAASDWIKMMHDDDFFASEDALQLYADAISDNVKFISAGFNEYFENTRKYLNKTISKRKFDRISSTPSLLFEKNLLGTPSVLMIHKSINETYDTNLKWFIDIEFYYRILKKEAAFYINQPLINISYNDSQITSYTRTNPSIVIPECLYLLNKHGLKIISNVMIYDAWWRIFRNFEIKNVEDLKKYSENEYVPAFIFRIIKQQQLISAKMLKIGYISKIMMALSYLYNKHLLKDKY